MTLFEQDQADVRLQQAHARFATTARPAPSATDAMEAVSPARIVVGVVRAGFAIASTALRARHHADPIALRPRVLGV